MKYVRWILFVLVLALLSTGAVAGALPSSALARMQTLAASVKARHVSSAQAQEHTAAWTLLVYMAADNDLETFGIADLNEMEFVGSTENANVVVQVDRSPQYDSSNGDWQGARRYFMTQDTDLDLVASQQVGDLGIVNMGDPATLRDFIEWGVTTYPAEHYALVIWDHGGSWLGIGIDDSSDGDALTLPELDEALKGATEATKVSKFDLIGFDACLMGSIEVYRTVAPYALYAVASPELIPGQGWDYAGALGAIADDPTIDAPTFGRAIVDNFNTFYTQIITTYDYFSLGLVDLSATADVVAALDAFTAAAPGETTAAGGAIARARSKALVFGAFDDPQYADVWAATDMIGFMQQVHGFATDNRVVSASDAVASAGEKMILYHLTSPTLSDSQGVSIYFPRTATFYTDRNRDQRYGQDTPSDLSPWQTFLGTFYSLFNGSRPQARITEATVDSNQQALFKLAFNGTGLSDALFYIALRLNGRPILVDYRRFDVGDFPAPGPAEPTVTWARNIPVVSDGTTQIPALLIRDRRNPLRGVVNGTFVPQNGDPQLPVQVLFDLTDPTQGKSISVWGVRESAIGPMPAQVAVKPGDKFIPAWLSIGANGQLNGRASNASLTFSTQPLLYFFINAPEAIYDIGVQAVAPSGLLTAAVTQAEVTSSGQLIVNPPPTEENPPEDSPTQEPTEPPTTPPPPPAESSSSESSPPPAGSIGSVGSNTVAGTVGQSFPEPFSVTVLDSDGDPVSGEEVTFSAPESGPSGTFAPVVVFAPTTLDQVVALLSGSTAVSAQQQGNGTSEVTVQTDETGTATSSTFTANTIAGSYVVKAQTSSGLTLDFHITNDPGAPVFIEAISGTPQSTEIGTEFPTALQALVTDSYGNSVPDVTVYFESPVGGEGPGASFDDGGQVIGSGPDSAIVAFLTGASTAQAQSGSAEVVTDELGIATAPALIASFTTGDFTVYAYLGDSEASANFDLTITAGAPAQIAIYPWVSEQSATVDTYFTNNFQVTVRDDAYNPVPGVTVHFSAPLSGPSGSFDDPGELTGASQPYREAEITTDENGVAEPAAFLADQEAGSYQVEVTVDEGDIHLSETIDLTNTPGDVTYVTIVNGADDQHAIVTEDFANPLEVKVTDQFFNPIPDITVELTPPEEGPGGGFLFSGEPVNFASGTTDSDGIFTPSTFVANSQAGAYQVAIGLPGYDVETPLFNLTNDPDAATTIQDISGAQSAVVGAAFTNPIQARVVDDFGNGVADADVTFDAPTGETATGTFASNDDISETVTSDTSGYATSSVFTASTTAGGYVVVASGDGLTSALISMTNEADAAAEISAYGGDPQQQAVSTEFVSPLTAKVVDQYGNPVEGVDVIFNAPVSDASGTFDSNDDVTETVATDADGLAASSAFTANDIGGDYSVTASVTGVGFASFSLTNLYPQPTTTSINPTEFVIGGSAITEITITGTNFVPDVSVPQFDDADRTATSITSTEIVMQLDSSDLLLGGAFEITVRTPFADYQGGAAQDAVSNAQTFTVKYPTPSLSSVSPNPLTAGGSAGSLTITGANFVDGATVHWRWNDGTDHDLELTTTYDSDTQLTADYSADDIAAGNTVDVVVVNPSPVDADSNAVSLDIENPYPTINVGVTPDSGTVGDDNTTIDVETDDGSYVTSSTVVIAEDLYGSVNPQTLETTFVDSNHLTAVIPASYLSEYFNYFILVSNPTIGGGGGDSDTQSFTVYNATPTLTDISPSSVDQGTTPELTLTGTNFVTSGSPDTFVEVNGAVRNAVVDSATQLRVTLQGEDTEVAGDRSIRVGNVNGSGGTVYSDSLTLTVLAPNPTPDVTGLSQTFVCPGSGDFTLQVYGTSFVTGAEVLWNGTALTTNFYNDTTLFGDVPASLIATPGSATITVRNPAPPDGGVTSSSSQTINFTENNEWSVYDGDGGEAATLRDTMAVACDGDTLTIYGQITQTSDLTVDKDVTIQGGEGEGAGSIIGSSEGIFHIASGATVTIQYIALMDATDSVIDNEGTLDISYVSFIDNSTSGDGASIHNTGTLTADYVNFGNSYANSGRGGAIYNTGTATLRNIGFENTTASQGGGIYNDGSLKLVNGTFFDATADEGASVYNAGGTAKLSFIAAVDSHGSPAFKGSGFEIKNSVLADSGSSGQELTCDPDDFSGSFSGVNFSDDTGCDGSVTGIGSVTLSSGNGPGGVFYFQAEGDATDAATDCTDTDGSGVSDSANGMDRPQGAECDAGPAEAGPA